MNRFANALIFISIFFLSQMGVANIPVAEFELADRYIANHSEIAMSEMLRTGVPASIKLAQGMLESDWGRSDLATVANNHFGIKCGSKWTGGTFYKSDDDRDKKGNIIESCFRSFDSTYESYIAHSDFLADPKKEHRYGFLFDLKSTDYKKWAKGLRKSGYATDPKYPKKLIQIIEKYELYRFDLESGRQYLTEDKSDKVLASNTDDESAENSIVENNTAKSLRTGKINRLRIVYSDGQASIKDIAKANRRRANQILKFNEIFDDENTVPEQGMVIYLQRKRSMTSKSQSYHIVVKGETMAGIAHEYGMKIKSLYIKNRMPEGAEPIVGEKLNLYRQVPLSKRPKFEDQYGNDLTDGELLFLDDPTLR